MLRNGFVFVILFSFLYVASAAESLTFLGDNNTSASYYAYPSGYTEMGGDVYFDVYEYPNHHLYRINESSSTINLVSNSIPAFDGSTISAFGATGDKLYFPAYSDKFHLWCSDGTAEGTKQLGDLIMPLHSVGNYFAAINDEIFFSGTSGLLYKSNGTDSGTTQVATVTANWLVASAGAVYFNGSTITEGGELWRTDGTDIGTTRVKDISPGVAGSTISGLTSIDGILYFSATDSSGSGLWKSDGTETGTVKIVNTNLITGSKIAGGNGTIYFIADDPSPGTNYQLWKTDGSGPGTSMVKDLTGLGNSAPTALTMVGNNIFLLVGDTSSKNLWVSDGTEPGTIELTAGGLIANNTNLTEAGGNVYFGASSSLGNELWISDGTVDGTTVTADLTPGSGSSSPTNTSNCNNNLYFNTRSEPLMGAVLKLDPISNLVTQLGSAVGNFDGYLGARIDGEIYFNGFDGEHGWEPWVTDGTPGGTHLLADIEPGLSSSDPNHFTKTNSDILFIAKGYTSPQAVWKTDGTELGTTKVKDVDLYFAYQVVAAGNRIYFTGYSSISAQTQLWSSDGTEAGTGIVDSSIYVDSLTNNSFLASTGEKVLFSGNNGPGNGQGKSLSSVDSSTNIVTDFFNNVPENPSVNLSSNAVRIDDNLYFFAAYSSSNLGLYRSDGTTVGTTLVKDIWFTSAQNPYICSGPVNGKFLFTKFPSNEVWISNGTSDGTFAIGPYSYEQSDFNNPQPLQVVALGDQLVYIGKTSSGRNPWITDGTASGTLMLKDINPDQSFDYAAYGPVSTGDIVYFSGNDGIHGYELWKTDGTPGGTVMVHDINPGPVGSSPHGMVYTGGLLAFSADDGINGRELWTLHDGDTQAQLTETASGALSGLPSSLYGAGYPFQTVGDNLVFQAYSPASGNDLWALPLPADSMVPDWQLY